MNYIIYTLFENQVEYTSQSFCPPKISVFPETLRESHLY